MGGFTVERVLGTTLVTQHRKNKVPVDSLPEFEFLILVFSHAACAQPFHDKVKFLLQAMTQTHRVTPKVAVVGVSTDRSKATFQKTMGSANWAFIPRAEKAIRERLRVRFRLQPDDVPELVVLNHRMETLTRCGKVFMGKDPHGSRFPWPKTSVVDVLQGPVYSCRALIGANGKPPKKAAGASEQPERWLDDQLAANPGLHVGLYFGASWLPSCVAFAWHLAVVFHALNRNKTQFAVVFCSLDRDVKEYEASIKIMPWFALPYVDQARLALQNTFEVFEAPRLVIMDPTGQVVTTSGVKDVATDPSGVRFPWHIRPCVDIENSIDDINIRPSVILFASPFGDRGQEAVAEFESLAAEFSSVAKALSDDPPFCFLVCHKRNQKTEDFCSLFRTQHDMLPFMVLTDFADQHSFFELEEEVADQTRQTLVIEKLDLFTPAATPKSFGANLSRSTSFRMTPMRAAAAANLSSRASPMPLRLSMSKHQSSSFRASPSSPILRAVAANLRASPGPSSRDRTGSFSGVSSPDSSVRDSLWPDGTSTVTGDDFAIPPKPLHINRLAEHLISGFLSRSLPRQFAVRNRRRAEEENAEVVAILSRNYGLHEHDSDGP